MRLWSTIPITAVLSWRVQLWCYLRGCRTSACSNQQIRHREKITYAPTDISCLPAQDTATVHNLGTPRSLLGGRICQLTVQSELTALQPAASAAIMRAWNFAPWGQTSVPFRGRTKLNRPRPAAENCCTLAKVHPNNGKVNCNLDGGYAAQAMSLSLAVQRGPHCQR